MRFMPNPTTPTPSALAHAAAALRAGELVGLPTETVYGLAALGLDADAVARIYAAKDRPSFNPLILHTTQSLSALHDSGIIDLQACTPRGRAACQALADALWPGPLTLVLPRGAAVPDLTTAGLDTVAIRQPRHPVAHALIELVGAPLAAPSANRSGRISPTTATAVLTELGDRVAMVLDGGPCALGLESSVVHVDPDGEVTLLRPGLIGTSTLSETLGRRVHHGTDAASRPRSPGTGSRHYSPKTPIFQLPSRISELDPERLDLLRQHCAPFSRVAVLTWNQTDAASAQDAALVEQITATAIDAEGRLSPTAQGLYATLRALDESPADLLLVEPIPPVGLAQTGLGFAIADRLSRATVPWSAAP